VVVQPQQAVLLALELLGKVLREAALQLVQVILVVLAVVAVLAP
jgi:hypothetical protein